MAHADRHKSGHPERSEFRCCAAIPDKLPTRFGSASIGDRVRDRVAGATAHQEHSVAHRIPVVEHCTAQGGPGRDLRCLVAPYRAILRYYRYDTPYRAILFKGV